MAGFLLTAGFVNAQPPLSPAYHNPDECRAELIFLQSSYSDLMKIDTIGYTSQFNKPILLIKISDNVERTESEPALLYVGQVHAEEVVGVEIVLRVMRLILENRDSDPYKNRLDGLELYFILTLNPDGFSIVHEGIDVTYRKNCRDNIGDGEFHFVRGVGHDSSGVDLNRNFGLHWDRGDHLFLDNGLDDAFNYYRGPAPFSEPETAALRDLMLSRRFLYAISYHSSRSGRNSELVIGPWSWDGKRPPEDDAIYSLASALADRIPRQQGFGNYSPVRATMRVGQEQDWAYQSAGCMMYMIEAGAEVQPDSIELMQVIDDNLNAAFYLMDLALGDTIPNGQGLISITTHDSTSGEPISAEVWLGDEPSIALAPLVCDPNNGRFDRLVTEGNYRLNVRRPGYTPFTIERVEIPDGGHVIADVALSKLPSYPINFTMRDDSTAELLSGRISIFGDRGEIDTDRFLEAGDQLDLPEGFHRILLRTENHVPRFVSIPALGPASDTINLAPGGIAFNENFDADRDWQQGGMQGRWSITQFDGRSCLTDSDSGDYPAGSDPWLMIETGLTLAQDHPAVLELIHRPYFEPGEDFGRVQAFDEVHGVWIPLVSFSCFPPESWDTSYVDLTGIGLEGTQLRLRFYIDSDATVTEDGWLIDNVSVYYANAPLGMSLDGDNLPSQISMATYPSPTNGAVTLLLELPQQLKGRLNLFDSLGRNIRLIHQGVFSAGMSRLPIDGRDLSSGTYFLVFQSEPTSLFPRKTTSFLLLK